MRSTVSHRSPNWLAGRSQENCRNCDLVVRLNSASCFPVAYFISLNGGRLAQQVIEQSMSCRCVYALY